MIKRLFTTGHISTTLLILASSGVLPMRSHAQSASLVPSRTQVQIDQPVTITIIVDAPTKAASGVEATIILPEGLVLKEEPSRGWYQQKWRDVSITPRLNGTELQFASALKSDDTACEGPCTIATFDVKATGKGTFPIQFVVAKTEALTADQQAIPFAELKGTTIQVGAGLVDTDTDGIPDEIEESLGLDPGKADTDENGTSDGDEDFDGDGIPNAEEVSRGLNPSLFVGDVSSDKNISGADATRVLQFLAGLREQASLGMGADVSNDGSITPADATRILQIIAGLRTSSSVQR